MTFQTKPPQRLDWAEQIAKEKAEKLVNSLIKGRIWKQ